MPFIRKKTAKNSVTKKLQNNLLSFKNNDFEIMIFGKYGNRILDQLIAVSN